MEVSPHLGNEVAWEGRAWVSAYPTLLHDRDLPRVRLISYRCNPDFKSLFFNYTIHKSWDHKQALLLAEIKSYKADIYCFQDIDHYEDFWYPTLTTLGYSIVYKQRTQEKDYHTEGIAIAFKSDRFQLTKTVILELNQSPLEDSGSIPPSFQEKCRTDDVGLILFLQPYQSNDIPTGLCIGNVMLDEGIHNHDVRVFHCKYFLQQLEKENNMFQFPVLLGFNCNDVPLSLAYTFLKTGRKPLTASVPGACTNVRAVATSRSTALVKWRAPKTTIADPTILYYRICWRPGGSTILSFKSQLEISSGDCIKYIEVVDEATKKKKIKASEDLEFIIPRLSAEIPYEFKVCAVNEMGVGEWSDPSVPVVMKNPERAPAMPEVINFKSLQEVKEQREEFQMFRADFNVHLAYVADPVNTGTQLTPRLIDGSIDHHNERAHVLPSYVNPRTGWNPALAGQPTEALMKEMNRDYTILTSAIRDKDGFKDQSLNKYQDGFHRSGFTQLNNEYEDVQALPITGSDGSTLILDAKVVFNHLGRPNERQDVATSFRSVYEGYGIGGEEMFNTSYPYTKGVQYADTLDYLFYSNHSGIILHRFLTLPNYLNLKHGETPEDNLSKEDCTTINPFGCMQYNFNHRIDGLFQKLRAFDNLGSSNDFSSQSNNERDKINQMKRNLKDILSKQDDLIPLPNPPIAESQSISPPPSLPKLVRGRTRTHSSFGDDDQSLGDRSESKAEVQPPQPRLISNILGGKWASFTEKNSSRQNYYLPNTFYGSSHLAIGAEFLFDDHRLNTNC